MGEGRGGEKQTTGAEECETEYDQHGGAGRGAGEREERTEARGERRRERGDETTRRPRV